jgi:hypothetical protein
MAAKVERRTVDLSQYPDLVVIYLGMRANSFKGMRAIMKLGPQIQKSVDAKPDGLLLHENFFFSFFPIHGGMRQYWRDFDSLERFTREMPHSQWWTEFLKHKSETGFWHETYSMRGGIEAIYDDMIQPVGMMQFAPVVPAKGRMFSARHRINRDGEMVSPSPLSEREIYPE